MDKDVGLILGLILAAVAVPILWWVTKVRAAASQIPFPTEAAHSLTVDRRPMGSGQRQPITDFIQPASVVEVAPDLLTPDPGVPPYVNDVADLWRMVVEEVAYDLEAVEFWKYPMETWADSLGDCEDTSNLLTSMLRNIYGPEDIFSVFGAVYDDGVLAGYHVWCVVYNYDGWPQPGQILETTYDPPFIPSSPWGMTEEGPAAEVYQPWYYFNDQAVWHVRGKPVITGIAPRVPPDKLREILKKKGLL